MDAMAYEFDDDKAVGKGAKAGALGAVALGLAQLAEQKHGVPVLVAAPVITAVLGYLRNRLKRRLPRWFGWL